MVRFLCEKCKQEASWVCLVGSREVFLCRSCEASACRGAEGGSQGLRRVALVNCTPDAHALLCGVCKDLPARVFSPSESQVYCWNCEKGASGVGPRYMVFGNAVSAMASNSKSSAIPTGSHSSDGPEGFAGWPSDSEDSLLIDFSQGLTPRWTGEPEFMQVNWSQGTGILKSQRETCTLEQGSWEMPSKMCLGCDEPVKHKDTLPKSETTDVLVDIIPTQAMGSPCQVKNMTEKFVTGLDGVPVVRPQLAALTSRESPSGHPKIVAGVPYGMVPVTVPPAFSRRHQKSQVQCRADHPSKSPETFKSSSIRRQCQSIGNVESVGGVENAAGTVLQSSCEDDDDGRDEGVGSGTSGSLGQPQRRCTHCGASKTPQWRAGPYGQKTLCNACGVKYKAGRLSSCSGPGGRSRKVSQISSRKMIIASQGRGS